MLEADVAGLRRQHGTDAQAQILDTRMAFTDMKELIAESGEAVDLQNRVGDLGLWQQFMNALLGLRQTCWFVELIEPRNHQPVLAADLFDARAGIRCEAFGHSKVGLIQLLGQRLQSWLGG